MNGFWNEAFLGNTIRNWVFFGGTLCGAILAVIIFRYIIVQQLKKWSARTTNRIDDFLVATIEQSIVPLLYLIAFYFSLKVLLLPVKAEKIIHVVFLVVTTYFVLRLITKLVKQFVFSFIKSRENGEAKEKQAKGLLIIVNAVIWILGLVWLIDNLGYNVTTLIAGLGIGGIAIALAAQAILGDLFSYFVIFFDRPFEIGDFIIVDDKMGVVEYVGIKTTRLRTLSGEQLICSNTFLTNAQIHNYKRMEQRRVVFSLGVIYQTTEEQLKQIPGLVKDIITSKTDVRLDRGHFSGFGASSLDFEFVYYILSADYNRYMDIQQEIYYDIFKAFNKEGIEFAYPTQTLFVNAETTEPVAS